MIRFPAPSASAGPGADPRTWARLAVLPFLVMAVVAAVDVLAGPKIGFIPLLSLGPALAAAALGPAQIVLAGGLAIALSLTLAAYDGFLASRQLPIILAAIAGVTAAGLVASAGRREKERELASVRAVAEVAQKVLLRPVPRSAGHLDFAVRYISAAAAARIGGDLYEVIVTGENTRLIVADVQGKGLGAVQTASVVLGAFREAAYDAADLAEIAARIELSLERQGSGEEFVTAVLAQIPDGGSIEILNCGHPPPLLLSGEAVRFAEPPDIGVPLGLSWLAVSPRKAGAFPFGERDRMLFYTDGISEARDQSGAFFLLERCAGLYERLDPDAALACVCEEVTRHVGHELHDDAALLLIRYRERGGPS